MEHSFVDKYSELDSFLHRLDPRTKIIFFLGFIILIVLTPVKQNVIPPNGGTIDFTIFSQYLLIIIALIVLSQVPILFILKRTLLVIPFILMIIIFIPFLKHGKTAFILNLWLIKPVITYEGLLVTWNVFIKSISSVLLLTILISTTNFNTMLKGLERLMVPKILIILLSFMYRYLFLLIDEAEHMQRARKARWFGGYIFRQIKIIGNMIALLFIRSYERAERVYEAMLARQFDGNIRIINNLKLTPKDAGFILIMLLLLIIIWYPSFALRAMEWFN
jgi:cobalt/nickel transport system permease protein